MRFLRAIEDLRQEVIMQVHTAFLNWQASLQRITRAEKTLAASRAELELAEKRYEARLDQYYRAGRCATQLYL